MAESTLALTKAQLQASCGTYAGWGRDPADWADDDKAAIIKEATDSGCRRVYYPEPLEGETVSHSWSFMRPTSDFPWCQALPVAFSPTRSAPSKAP